MKKIFTIVILFICTFGFSDTYKKNINKDQDYFEIYYQGKRLTIITVEQFKSMLHDARLYNIERDIEENNGVRIYLKDNPWNIETDQKTFKTEITLRWEDDKGQVIKEMILVAEFGIPEGSNRNVFPEWRRVYRNVSEVGFPVSVVLNVIFIIVAVLL